MSNRSQYNDNKKEQIISGIITFIISAVVLLFLLLYKTTFTTVTPPTYIDINFETDDLGANFGTDEVGLGEEEPIDQDVLHGKGGDNLTGTTEDNSTVENNNNSEPVLTDPTSKEAAPAVSTKDITKKNKTPEPSTKSKTKNTKSENKAGTEGGKEEGNPKGNAAIGNLLKGKGNSSTSTGEGTGGRPGQNQGVPDGGSGSGGEGIGNGRKLIGFIPGTMGRGGKVPNHNCKGSGTIVFSYTVDKNGNIISVNRISGTSNPCLINTGIEWIKKYVKADKGTRAVTGTYRINF